jgi:hypothetical protein
MLPLRLPLRFVEAEPGKGRKVLVPLLNGFTDEYNTLLGPV